MKENTCKYSEEWQPYIGDYDKYEYDIRTKDGKEINNCYPNAGKFNPVDSNIYIKEEDVNEIRFSDNPVMSLNWSVSSKARKKIEEEIEEGRKAGEREQFIIGSNTPIDMAAMELKNAMRNSNGFAAPTETTYIDAYKNFDLNENLMYDHLTKKQREANIESIRIEPKYERNKPCHCGSGKKYKHCCNNN